MEQNGGKTGWMGDCPCGSGDAAECLTVGGRSIVRCLRCGLLRTAGFARTGPLYCGNGFFPGEGGYVARGAIFRALFESLVDRIVRLGGLILPLALGMPEALGPVGLLMVALALGVTLASLPLQAELGATRRPAALLAGLCLAASVGALLTPASTPRDPEHGSMIVAEEAGGAGAALVIRPESDRLAAGVAQAARFERRTTAFPWARPAPASVAPLPPIGLPCPTLDVLGEEAGADGRRRLTLRLSSPRGAAEIGLAFAVATHPNSPVASGMDDLAGTLIIQHMQGVSGERTGSCTTPVQAGSLP